MYYFWLGWGFLFVCIFLLLPLLLSELTLLKVNVACVPAENVLWKKSLFIPLLKISFKKSKKYNVFSCQSLNLCISPSLSNLLILMHGKKSLEPVSFVALYWKIILAFSRVNFRVTNGRVKPACGLQSIRRRFSDFFSPVWNFVCPALYEFSFKACCLSKVEKSPCFKTVNKPVLNI